MSEAEGISATTESFLEYLKGLPWCKQGADVLVAVHKCTPEIIDAMKDHPAKVHPGGMTIKLNKSFLHDLQNKFDDGQPLPAVLVWKPQHVEIWYRKNNPMDFPWDTWSNPVAAAHERECITVPCELLGDKCVPCHADILGRAKECPSMIPPH